MLLTEGIVRRSVYKMIIDLHKRSGLSGLAANAKIIYNTRFGRQLTPCKQNMRKKILIAST